jgi:hypothetical protein
MVCVITGDVMAQQPPPGITLKTTKRGDPLPPHSEPAPDSERFKTTCVATKDTTDFRMYLWEYVNGEKIEEHPVWENISYRQLLKGNKISWEVVPDISEQDTFRIYVYFPGFIAHRLKVPNAGKCFKYAPYQPTENAGLTKEIPVMLLYEDDATTHETEKLVKKYLTDGKLNPAAAKNKVLLSKIKRYAILLYTLN